MPAWRHCQVVLGVAPTLCAGVLTGGPMDRAMRLTIRLARCLGRPHLTMDLLRQAGLEAVIRWLSGNGIRVLNVAGPRETSSPGCYRRAKAFMDALLNMDYS